MQILPPRRPGNLGAFAAGPSEPTGQFQIKPGAAASDQPSPKKSAPAKGSIATPPPVPVSEQVEAQRKAVARAMVKPNVPVGQADVYGRPAQVTVQSYTPPKSTPEVTQPAPQPNASREVRAQANQTPHTKEQVVQKVLAKDAGIATTLLAKTSPIAQRPFVLVKKALEKKVAAVVAIDLSKAADANLRAKAADLATLKADTARTLNSQTTSPAEKEKAEADLRTASEEKARAEREAADAKAKADVATAQAQVAQSAPSAPAPVEASAAPVEAPASAPKLMTSTQLATMAPTAAVEEKTTKSSPLMPVVVLGGLALLAYAAFRMSKGSALHGAPTLIEDLDD